MTGTFTLAERKQCAEALEHHKHEVASSLLDHICVMPKWQQQRDARVNDIDSLLRDELYAFVDYLIRYIRDADSTFQALYVGEKLKQLYIAGQNEEQRSADRDAVLQQDAAFFQSFITNHTTANIAEQFMAELAILHRLIAGQAGTTLNVLFVGDCLFLDINAFIIAPCLKDGIAIRPTFLTSKNPVELRAQLQKHSHEKFDAVFYSPFTFEFSISFATLQNRRQGRMKRADVQQLVGDVIGDTAKAVSLLADLYDCPVHIHNAANIIREESSLKRRINRLLTARVRRQGRELVNAWLGKFIAEKNTETFHHLFLFDERTLSEQHCEQELGEYIYWSDIQHPCRFSKVIADQYVDLLYVHAKLAKKKLVVCDLDNTLWDGIIGEGEVQHCHERQASLKRLKAKGVVLAVNSKNDPKNVHYRDGTLSEDDFVYSDINWEPKVNGMRRIQESLNLKTKDYVFIDDRADEREMSRMTFPGLVALDPCADRTWRLFELWHDMLDPDGTSDRTEMYRQREERKQFLHETAEVEEQNDELFYSLDLKLHIRAAEHDDLKRATELINRTNQFNMLGSRVTYREVCDWHDSDAWQILLADASDRFGDMGTISILIAERTKSAWDIPVFVLSCRVFGYGIERAMLNALKRMSSADDQRPAITGRYVDTGRNQPCESVYADNGFVEQSGVWTYDSLEPAKDVGWLDIRLELPPATATTAVS